MDRLRAMLWQLRDFFAALPPARRTSFVALTVAVLGGTVALAWWVGQPSYRVLYANLGPADAGAVVEYLKAERVPYRVSDSGTTVEVPAAQIHETRLALAASGVPRGGGGVGFEIFDKQTLGMTDFVQRLNYQRALQGELARTITQIDAVEAARVHLALPERSLFVAEDRPPSASAVLKLRPGRSLDPDQVAGVVHLIAASVEGLKPTDVTVVDVDGQVLTRDIQEADRRPVGQGMLALQRELEHDYIDRIETMLGRVLGPGQALARVTLALDLSQVERTEESYDPDRVAVRTEKRSRETSTAAAAASAAREASAPLTNDPAPPAGAAEPSNEREDAALSYEISKVTSRRVEAMGAIRKLTVAVMLDGTYEGEGEQRTFVPRPAEEITRYTELIKRAVGFNEERGDEIEVASVPLQSGPAVEPPAEPGLLARLGDWSEVLWRAGGLVAVLVVALAVVRPFLLAMASRAPVAAPVTPERVALAHEPSPALAALDVARGDPDHTAQVIRQWLATKP
jgi:flagellar M-ring protein FliF